MKISLLRPSLWIGLALLPVALAGVMGVQRRWMPTVIRMYAGPVQSVRFSSDGKRVIITGTEGEHTNFQTEFANELDAESLRPIRRLARVFGEAQGFALSPDNKTVSRVLSDKLLFSPTVWMLESHIELNDARSGKLLWKHQPSYLFTTVTFSPNGEWLASARLHESIYLRSLRTSRTAFLKKEKGDVASPDTILFLADPRHAVTGSRAGDVVLWDARSWKRVRSFHVAATPVELDSPGTGLFALSLDRRWVAIKQDVQTVSLWDFGSGKLRARLSSKAQHLAFSPDGNTLASAESSGSITLWDTRTGSLLRTMSLAPRGDKEQPFEQPDLSHTPNAIISVLSILPRGKATTLAWSPDGKTLVTGHDDGSVARWRVK